MITIAFITNKELPKRYPAMRTGAVEHVKVKNLIRYLALKISVFCLTFVYMYIICINCITNLLYVIKLSKVETND